MNDKSVAFGSSFSKQLSNTYYMSIQLSLGGLSFCIFDPVKNAVMAIGSKDFGEIDEHFARHEEYLLTNDLFRLTFKQVLVSVESRAFSLVPKMLYDPERAKDVLRFIGCDIASDDKILTDEIPVAGALTLYAVPSFLYYFLQTQFPGVKIVHSTTPNVIPALTKRSSEHLDAAIANLVFSRDGVSIVVVENNMLKLCNKFKFKEVTDIVYIVLYTLEQLGLNNGKTRIVISGDLARTDARAQLMRRFAHNVSLAKLPDYFDYEVRVPQPEHQFVNLLNMSLCV